MANPKPASGPNRAAPPRIDGPSLARAFADGATALRAQADALNAINVFPVPDGDTGTNMSLTMKAAVEGIDGADSLAEAAKRAARGALLGAKGNSGVILSQIIEGFASAMPPTNGLSTGDLARALERARQAAYRVVSTPKEGTILTAISAAAEAAGRAHAGEAAVETLESVVAATEEAVARTPDLLPVLKEAGVVDAGAQGLYVLLDAMLRSLRGDAPPPRDERLGQIDASWLAATERAHDAQEGQSGFCTEFVVSGEGLDAEAIRSRLLEMGESVIVVGGDDLLRAHVHTREPDAAFAFGRTLGELSHEKADDMEAQFRALSAERRHAARTESGIAVVAVGAGAGIEELLRSIGATQVVHGGQTMNPSAGDIRAAIEATGTRDVIVLPDNKNVIMAARQAAEGLPGRVRVLPSRSIPQGVAALVAMNTENSLDENVEAMERAITGVHTGEVTFAARDTRVHGLEIGEGQPIGLVDGDLVVAAATLTDAARQCVARMTASHDGEFVTLYAGAGAEQAETAELAETLRREFDLEVEVVEGGQPHYPYLIGLE
jgi:DAK2 domain fusion protein YloV